MRLALFSLAVLLACELLWRLHLPRVAGGLLKTAKKAKWIVLNRRISDHWKEKAMLVYSGKLLSSTFLLAGIFLVALSPFFLLSFVFPGGVDELGHYSLQILPLLCSILIGVCFVWLRPRVTK